MAKVFPLLCKVYLQAKKRVVLVIARQHPGKSPSSLMRRLYLQSVVLVIARQHPGDSPSSLMRSLYLQAKKRVVLVIARQHPGESPSSFVVQGIFKKPLEFDFLYLNCNCMCCRCCNCNPYLLRYILLNEGL
jgi:hypothetical protein